MSTREEISQSMSYWNKLKGVKRMRTREEIEYLLDDKELRKEIDSKTIKIKEENIAKLNTEIKQLEQELKSLMARRERG